MCEYKEKVFACRSARMGDEIGGHHVSGHVHTTAVLCAVDHRDPNNCMLTFQVGMQCGSWAVLIAQVSGAAGLI